MDGDDETPGLGIDRDLEVDLRVGPLKRQLGDVHQHPSSWQSQPFPVGVKRHHGDGGLGAEAVSDGEKGERLDRYAEGLSAKQFRACEKARGMPTKNLIVKDIPSPEES